MKYILIAAALVLTSCAVTKPAGPIRLTITYIHREAGKPTMVQARDGYKFYNAKCQYLPDTVRVGSIITANPTKEKDINCNCLFFRIK